MIRTILVPLDGSTPAESVLPKVEALARLVGASVTLLRAIEPLLELADEAAADGPTGGIEEVFLERQADARAEAQGYLDGVARRLVAAGLAARTLVVVGPAAEAIIDQAGSFDLVAMATHGRSGPSRWAFGSVADKVVRGAPAPVLLVRTPPGAAPDTAPPRRILVPLDGSALAERALPAAIDLARRAGAELVLMRSFTWPLDVATAFAYLDPVRGADLLAHDEARARAYLTEVERHLAGQGLGVAARLRFEPAADAILAAVEEERIDLIVMSTHGRGGLGRWALGSIADRVLRGAPVPILLVRAHLPAGDGASPLRTRVAVGVD